MNELGILKECAFADLAYIYALNAGAEWALNAEVIIGAITRGSHFSTAERKWRAETHDRGGYAYI